MRRVTSQPLWVSWARAAPLLVVLAAACGPGPGGAEPSAPAERWVVGVRGPVLPKAGPDPRLRSIRAATGAREVRRLRRAVVLVPGEGSDGEALARRLAAHPDVRWVEPEVWLPVTPRAVPDDPLYPAQWTLHPTADPGIAPQTAIGVEAAWDVTRGVTDAGTPVRVAVIDDGFDLGHPQLRFVAGADFSADEGAPGWDDDPSNGPGDVHGTQTAGVIAATGFDGEGLTGVCPDCELVGVRLIGGGVPPDLYVGGSAAAAAIEYAAFTAAAAVINNSWGPPDGNPFDLAHRVILQPPATADRPAGVLPLVVQEALRAAATEARGGLGAVITWAAGNGNEMVTYDAFAASPWVLAVGSVDAGGRRAYYSDYGPPILLTAPSSGLGPLPAVLTTDLRGAAGEDPSDVTSRFGGTSAAAAEVAGVAALVLAAFPQLTVAQTAEAMALGARRVDERFGEYTGEPGRSPYYGFGRVDAAGALARAALYTDGCTLGLEPCNGLDDDCDGAADEGCTTCRPDANGREVCDAADNDCDGRLNEDFVCVATDRPTCAPCTQSTQCALEARCASSPSQPGTFCSPECSGAADCPPGFACNGVVCLLDPSDPAAPGSCADYLRCEVPEICDGVDQDCDGDLDDVDLEGAEAEAARRRCRDLGCPDARAECNRGAWLCTLPPEACGDGVDNDCDGQVDEACPVGSCAAGPGGAAPPSVALALAAWAARRRRSPRRPEAGALAAPRSPLNAPR